MTLLQSPDTLKKTPLYDRHASLGGKLVDFNGWALPVYYTGIIPPPVCSDPQKADRPAFAGQTGGGIIAEHLWTRESCSFFDVSHLGEIEVSGPAAFEFLQRRLTCDLSKSGPGRMIYGLLCDENGCALDDILVYCGAKQDFHLIVNAANIGRDVTEFRKYAAGDVRIEDHSDDMACIAVQGPESERILEKLFGLNLKDMVYYTFKEEKISGRTVWTSRSGYTGEDGFELFCLNEAAPALWDALAGPGKKEGAMPAGLGARNTLRLEAGNPLYGHELDESTTPLEAGLGFAIGWDKGDFVGRQALWRQKQGGLKKRLVGFRMKDKAVARDGYEIFKNGKPVGRVTSGSFAPSVGGNIGLAFVATGQENLGNEIEIEIHGRLSKAQIVRRPFVALKHKK